MCIRDRKYTLDTERGREREAETQTDRHIVNQFVQIERSKVQTYLFSDAENCKPQMIKSANKEQVLPLIQTIFIIYPGSRCVLTNVNKQPTDDNYNDQRESLKMSLAGTHSTNTSPSPILNSTVYEFQ